jgi:hypothetical protein
VEAKDPDSDHGPYDQVTVTNVDGEARRLTRVEFESLPLDQRVRTVLQKRIKFFRRGKEIPVREALRDH